MHVEVRLEEEAAAYSQRVLVPHVPPAMRVGILGHVMHGMFSSGHSSHLGGLLGIA